MDYKKVLEYLESYLTERRKELIDDTRKWRTRHIIMVAEDTYQEHNASALVRTADCFGLQEVHIIERRHEYKMARRMTRGADKWVEMYLYDDNTAKNTQFCIDQLKNRGYKLVATTPHENSISIHELPVGHKLALFFGREKEGLSKNIIDQADHLVHIPMYGFTESFNVSVSAALSLQILVSKLHNFDRSIWGLSLKDEMEKRIEWYIKSMRHGKDIYKKFLSDNLMGTVE